MAPGLRCASNVRRAPILVEPRRYSSSSPSRPARPSIRRAVATIMSRNDCASHPALRNTSTANSVAGNGANAEGMIVGSSTTADNSEHAFLFVEDKMYDLNNLCDLSQTNFKVLTVARTISDSLIIIGDGITKNGDKHAFK